MATAGDFCIFSLAPTLLIQCFTSVPAPLALCDAQLRPERRRKRRGYEEDEKSEGVRTVGEMRTGTERGAPK